MANGAGAVNIRLGATITEFLTQFRAAGAGVSQFAVRANTDLAQFYRAQDARNRTFQQGLGRAGADLEKFGRRMSAVTLGIGLTGAAMFSTYADLDGMTRGFRALSGSTQLAEADFKAFREIAKLPGLGLQEAEEAGLRMKALGYSTQEATRDLKEIGNAIALGGKGKTEFDSVLNQITQMSSKSKVLAEDLKPIVNASPVIAKVVSEIFGSVDSEQISKKLQAAGKGPQDFIKILVDGLSKLERVSGGPKNAIENLGDAAKIASFEVGKAADRSLDLTGKLTTLGDGLQSAATGFGELSSGSQAAILTTTGLVAAIGPLTLALGGTINLVKGLTAQTGALAVGWQALTSTAGIITGIVAAVGAAGYALYQYNSTVEKSVNHMKLLEGATAAVQQQVSLETSRLQTLVTVARDESASKTARLNAIREINAVSPRYLGDLTLETIGTEKATKAIARYTQVLNLKAQAQVYAQKLAEAEARKSQLQAQAPEVSNWDRLAAGLMNPFASGGAEAGAIGRTWEKRIAEMQRTQQELDFFRAKAEDANRELAKLGELSTEIKTPDFSGSGGTDLEKAQARFKELDRQMKDFEFRGLQPPKAIADEYEKLKKKLGEVKDAFSSTSKAQKDYSPADIAKNAIKALDEEIASLKITGNKVSSVYKDELGNGIPLEKLKEFKGEWMDLLGLIKKADLPEATQLFSPYEMFDGFDKAGNPTTTYDMRLGERMAGQGKLQSQLDYLSSADGAAARLDPVANQDANAYRASLSARFDFISGLIGEGAKEMAGLGTTYKEMITQMGEEVLQSGVDAGMNIADGLGAALGGIITGQRGVFKNFGKMLVESAAGFLSAMARANLTAGLAAIAASTFPPNPIGLASGKKLLLSAAGLTVAAGTVRAIGSSIKMPAFAEGGILSGPVVGLMGEYPGARRNPEVITPLDKLQNMINWNGGGGFADGQIVTVWRGDAIYGIWQQENNKKKDRGAR